MQPTQDVFYRAGVILLNELDRAPHGSLKLTLVEALEKEASIITKYLGLK